MRAFTDSMKVGAWVLIIAAGMLGVVFAVISWMIGSGVNETAEKAAAQFAGDRVEALIALVECDYCSLRDRTRAVWALGQLRDKRALPVLYKYYTGEPCDHQRQICQGEITKAIRWTEGKSFMLPQVWRLMLRSDRAT